MRCECGEHDLNPVVAGIVYTSDGVWSRKYVLADCRAYWRARAEAAEKRVAELEADLKLNASMLAKQCDMAREAENKQAVAERDAERLANAAFGAIQWIQSEDSDKPSPIGPAEMCEVLQEQIAAHERLKEGK